VCGHWWCWWRSGRRAGRADLDDALHLDGHLPDDLDDLDHLLLDGADHLDGHLDAHLLDDGHLPHHLAHHLVRHLPDDLLGHLPHHLLDRLVRHLGRVGRGARWARWAGEVGWAEGGKVGALWAAGSRVGAHLDEALDLDGLVDLDRHLAHHLLDDLYWYLDARLDRDLVRVGVGVRVGVRVRAGVRGRVEIR